MPLIGSVLLEVASGSRGSSRLSYARERSVRRHSASHEVAFGSRGCRKEPGLRLHPKDLVSVGLFTVVESMSTMKSLITTSLLAMLEFRDAIALIGNMPFCCPCRHEVVPNLPTVRSTFDIRHSNHDQDEEESWIEENEIEIGLPENPSSSLTGREDVLYNPSLSEHNNVNEPDLSHLSDNSDSSSSTGSSFQYAALEPGTVVQIQVGDISLARKAWKKRRRSGSPLLVPCSVLNADRASTIRWNLIYLLEKFGTSGNNKNDGIRISFVSLKQRYRSHLKGSLQKHAALLGFDTYPHMIESLFNPRVQETYGVKLIQQDDEETGRIQSIQAPLSRLRAQKRANKAAVLQFKEDETQNDTLLHTGFVRIKNPRPSEQDGNSNFYLLRPLSVALRVAQKEDVESGKITHGSLHPAVIFDYDPAGDAGAPLLTLSLDGGRNQVRERLRIPSHRERQLIHNPKYTLKDLHMGDGPMSGKVVRLIKGGALVDCSVGRDGNSTMGGSTRKDDDSNDMVQVLGYLRFEDTCATSGSHLDGPKDEVFSEKIGKKAMKSEDDWDDLSSSNAKDSVGDQSSNSLFFANLVERDGGDKQEEFNCEDVLAIEDLGLDDDEEFADSEDITHMFEISDDGSLVYTEEEKEETSPFPSTTLKDDAIAQGETRSSAPHETSDDEYDDDSPVIFNKNTRGDAGSRKSHAARTRRLHIGDTLEVFVKSVSKQSCQLQLTMNSEGQGRKARDIKRETECEKKLARLEKQLGGLHRINELKGRAMNGVVKAMSNTGDWLYVQPSSDDLPVGVATLPEDHSLELKQGDAVLVQLDGIDSSRGQLALKVLRKLSP